MKELWIGFSLGLLFMLSIWMTVVNAGTVEKKAIPASSCKPAPGQCAYDGNGVYCLLPTDKTPLRNGEPK